MASYTITRALTRVKTLNARLIELGSNSNVNILEYVNTAALDKKDTKKHQDYITNSEAKFNQFNDLFAELVRIKNAIKASNAVTTITLLGEEMTVSEAITLKEVIGVKHSLYREILNRHAICESKVETEELSIEAQARASLKDLPKDSDPALLEKTFEMFKASISRDTRLYVATGINIAILRKDYEEINTFLEEIDYKLSESNSVTSIEIE